MSSLRRIAVLTPVWLLCGSLSAAEPRKTDVVVYGGTAGGAIAAVAVAREGKSVVVLEPGKYVGGMVTGGLGATDVGNSRAVGGYSREFFNRVREYYTRKYGPMSQQVKDSNDGFRFEPHVAALILHEMLNEAKVEVLHGQRLDKVTKNGKKIERITTEKGDAFEAAMWIDATYEGDLLAKAGVSYTVGREGREKYDEWLAGVQARSPFHQWSVNVKATDDNGKLLPFVQPDGPGATGAGDNKVQAYNFRLCMTDRKDNQVPFPKPKNYDPDRYELLARYLKAKPDVKVGQLMNPVRMPNGKTDTNNNGPFSTDHIGASWEYPDADYAKREKIWQDHVEYVQGFTYFLANDPRVPKALHEEMNRWGLAKDEFTDNANWPHQLYIREARRMVGDFVMTQHDLMDRRSKDDSVGMGSYNADSHHVQRVATKDGFALNEGDFQVGVRPYAISYRCLTPKATDCENLLVPVCVSASHAAYGSVRMEPVFMILGQASGVAASMAIDGKLSVQKVPADQLTAKLKSQKAVLSPDELPQTAGSAAARIDPAKLTGVVVDDVKAEKTGEWRQSASAGPFVGEGYLHDSDSEKGKMKVRFVPKLPTAGKYEVRLFYSPNPNRATNTVVVVHSEDGEKMFKVNQKLPLKGGEGHKLGVFTFTAGEKGWVEVRNESTDGHVIADAVQFIAVK